MQIQAFNDAYLVFEKSENAWAVLVDPGNEWKNIQAFLKTNQLTLKYILLSKPTFKNAFRVNQIKQETGAKFLSFQSDMLQLRKLPKLADEVNVCGIKVPQIDRFLDGLTEVDLGGSVLKISMKSDHYEYQINSHVIPLRKVESPGKME
jgi:hypothetical protein